MPLLALYFCFYVTRLLLPRAVHDAAAVRLALLQQHLALPLVPVARVAPPTGFDAEAAAGTARGHAGHLGHVDVLARVELERGLGAEDLEVDLGLGVLGANELGQRRSAGVNGDVVGRLVDDEAVVDIRLLRAQGKRLVALQLAERRRAAGRDATVIDGQVAVRGEGDNGALD